MSESADFFISITPEPTRDERDAVVAVMVMHHRARDHSVQDAEAGRQSRWSLAGRREALRGRGKAEVRWGLIAGSKEGPGSGSVHHHDSR